jgi:hypothetical protein
MPSAASARPLSVRFWEHVEKTEGCWNWRGYLSDGYGSVKVGSRSDGSRNTRRAHRVAWELQNGPVPDGLYVCHRCDNRACVRPDHLFLGTHSDNMRDAGAKGRLAPPQIASEQRIRGEAHPRAKVCAADVIEIRRRAATEPRTDLAREYGMSRQALTAIVQRKHWRHIP